MRASTSLNQANASTFTNSQEVTKLPSTAAVLPPSPLVTSHDRHFQDTILYLSLELSLYSWANACMNLRTAHANSLSPAVPFTQPFTWTYPFNSCRLFQQLSSTTDFS